MSQLEVKHPGYRLRVADQIVGFLHAGAPLRAAAETAGVPLDAVIFWMEKNKSFRQRVEMAQSGVEVLLTGRIREASGGADGDWRAAAWQLERMDAESELERLRKLTTDP